MVPGVQPPSRNRAFAVYRAASREFHPDTGGSHERMVAVNRAVGMLRKAGVAP